MAFLRLLLMLLVAQTVAFVSLLLFMRARRRDRLISDYSPEATEKEREIFVDAQMDSYMKWLRPRLALIVYAVPIIALSVLVYVTNF